jgi:3-oxoacyl-[acyl-carrier-protein] synthase-1
MTLVSPLGRGLAATADALREERSGLAPCRFEGLILNTHIGLVAGVEDAPVVPQLNDYDGRNNRLAQLALQADAFEDRVRDAAKRHGGHRIAIVIGTASSGIQEAEHAYAGRRSEREPLQSFRFEYSQSHFSVARFVQSYLGLSGPVFSVSTACSSSSKAFSDAQQMIAIGLCDAAVVGGVDSMCWMSLCGFHSLQLLSTRPCRPNDADRDGISIGEAAGFALLERDPDRSAESSIALLGCGESCDAYHMSAPHPEGLGAVLAMRCALERARIEPADVDYINLHGTGSPANDRAEDLAVAAVFGPGKLCSSTKGLTGHTLGAAGMTEVAISALCLMNGFVPANLNLETPDPEFQMSLVRRSRSAEVRCVLTNSFGFGGSNSSLVLAKT